MNRTDSFLRSFHEEVKYELLNKTAHLSLNPEKRTASDQYCKLTHDIDKEEETWSCFQDKVLRVLNYKCSECVDKYEPMHKSVKISRNHQEEEEEEIETIYLQNFSEQDLVEIEIVPSVLPTAEHVQVVNMRDNIFIRTCRCIRNVLTFRQCRRK
ncbi:hypothetical protein FQR65_LT02481 [Abscondita terminalis]|nr:hypothetical protein FQR65_LT02481 [Abscondita terminalis]